MNTEQNDELQTEAVIRPGDTLRQAREKRGYSQADIANRLRLRLSVIQDIENNSFDQEQIATFTRGYIRSYARFVELDADEILSQLDQMGQIQPQAQEMQSFSRRTKREAHDSRVMKLTWVIFAVFIGFTAVWWWQSLQVESGAELAPQEPQLAAVAADEQGDVQPEATQATIKPELVEPVASAEAAAVDAEPSVEQTEEPLEVAKAQETVVPAQASTDTPAEPPQAQLAQATTEKSAEPAPQSVEPAPTPVAADGADLELSFNGDCWIDIRDADGKRLDTGIKKPGQTLQLNGKAPFKLVLGAPEMVKVTYQGKAVDMTKYPAGKVARFKLPK